MATYASRDVDYTKIHTCDPNVVSALYQSLDISGDSLVANFMAGHGDMSFELFDYYSYLTHATVTSILIDKYAKQLPESNYFPKIVSDVMSCPLSQWSVDGVIMKLGIHEIPKGQQQFVFNQAYRILSARKHFSIFEIAERSDEYRELFSKIVRKKDELAGFYDLEKNRCFCTEKELFTYFQNAGFNSPKKIATSSFNYNYMYLLKTDFEGNVNKLREFLQFIRETVSASYRKELGFEDYGTSIKMNFWQSVITATK